MASRWRAGEVLMRRRRLPRPAWVMSERPQRRQRRQRSLCRTLGSHIWKHLIWAELLSLSTGGHTDTPRCGQGTNKRTLSAPSCKYLTPPLTIQSRTSLTLKLSQQHRFSLRRSLTHAGWRQLWAILCTFMVLVYFQCRYRALFAPAIFAGALDADSLLPACARQVGALSCCSNVLQCEVFSSRLATFAKLNESDVTPPPATNYSWKMGKVTRLVTILSGEN